MKIFLNQGSVHLMYYEANPKKVKKEKTFNICARQKIQVETGDYIQKRTDDTTGTVFGWEVEKVLERRAATVSGFDYLKIKGNYKTMTSQNMRHHEVVR